MEIESIFDKKIKDPKLLDELYGRIISNFSSDYNAYSLRRNLNWFGVTYLNGYIDLEYFLKHNENIDLLELFVNLYKINKPNSNDNLFAGIIKGIIKLLDDKNIIVEEISKENNIILLKFVSKDINSLIQKVENKEWRNQIDLFFIQKDLIE